MGKNIKIGDVFQPGDILALMIIVAGVLIAIFLEGLAVKLIGVSIAVLGLLAVVMLISQRISDMVVSNKFNLPNQPNFTMTVVKDATAKRQTIEDLDISSSSEFDISKMQDTMGADEGYRIVSKSTRQPNPPKPTEDAPISAHAPTSNPTDEQKDSVLNSDNIESAAPEEQKIESQQPTAEPTEPISSENDSIPSKEELFDSPQPIPFINVTEETTKQQDEKSEIAYSPISNASEATTSIKPDAIEPNVEQIAANVDTTQTHEQTEVIDTIDMPEKKEEEVVYQNFENNPIQNIDTQDTPIATNEKEIPEAVASSATERNFEPLQKPEERKPKVPTETYEKYKKNTFDTPIALLTDDEPNISKEPRKEFENYITRILLVIRSVIKTRTATLILTNSERTQLVLESYITSVPDAIATTDRIPMTKDIVSQILSSGKPEILTEINPSAELDLIPYYSVPTGVSSFIGLPVFYQKEPIGVLCCDTNESDAYNSSTVSFLSHFSKLISNLMVNYSEKFDLLHAEQALLAINNFNQFATEYGVDFNGISKAITNSITSMYEVENMGVCLFDEKRNNWFVIDYHSLYKIPDYIKQTNVHLGETLIGDSIIQSKTIVELPIKSTKTRVFKQEVAMPGGFFIAIPIKSEHNTYGAFYIEGTSHSSFINFDLNILETIANTAGVSVERINLINMLQKGSIVDPETGLMNSVAFFRRLQEEVSRTIHLNSVASLLFISIDRYAAFDESGNSDHFERINHYVIDLLNKNLNEYDVLGRVDVGIFGVVLIGQNNDKAKIWAERVRNSSAISVIDIEHKRFTVTLSIGLSEISHNDTIHSLTANANKALNIAAARTNSVQVFQ